jgi:hypothetical protein
VQRQLQPTGQTGGEVDLVAVAGADVLAHAFDGGVVGGLVVQALLPGCAALGGAGDRGRPGLGRPAVDGELGQRTALVGQHPQHRVQRGGGLVAQAAQYPGALQGGAMGAVDQRRQIGRRIGHQPLVGFVEPGAAQALAVLARQRVKGEVEGGLQPRFKKCVR